MNPTTIGTAANVQDHTVVSPEAWREARLQLLAREKELTRLRDEVSAARRVLPWTRVTKAYEFTGPKGTHTLAELFGRRSQLVIYHFMLGPGWEQGCKSCSFLADHFDGMIKHLPHRDVSFAVVSRAPWSEIAPFKQRMGWKFPWYSSHETTFNFDFHVSASPEEVAAGTMEYNYRTLSGDFDEMPGMSVFYKNEAGEIFHTYSTFERGLDPIVGTFQVLDLTPKGRDESPEQPMVWVRHHDRYEDASATSCASCG